MTIGLRLFISSAIFSITLSVAYWLVSAEITGTFLLGFMAFALTFVAGYMIVAERNADLWGDRKDSTPDEAAGEVIGTYTVRSPLPFWSALAVVVVLLGLVLSPSITAIAFIAILGLAVAFILQSR